MELPGPHPGADPIPPPQTTPNKGAQAVLLRSLPSLGLKPGAVGVVVHVSNQGESYEVEFMNRHGGTIGVATVDARDVRLAPDASAQH